MSDFHDLTIIEASRLIGACDLSPVEYTQALLERIEDVNHRLHAFSHIAGEQAMEQAQTAAAEIVSGHRRGPLHGIPYALKDMIDYADLPTTAMSRILANSVAGTDAGVTQRLKAAGGVFLGKLTTHEFAIGGPPFDLPWPPARNPWNVNHDPGGSSSGAGVALAAGLIPAAIGTDTGGSIRDPALACGIVGMKPTFGHIDTSGVFPLSPTYDHVGPMTRTVEDNALLLGIIAEHDPCNKRNVDAPPGNYVSGLRAGVEGLRIGYLRHFHEDLGIGADPEMVASLDAAVDLLGDMGAEIREVTVRPLSEYADVYQTIMLSDAYAIHHEWLRDRPEDYGIRAREKILSGSAFTPEQRDTAARTRQSMINEFSMVMKDFDALICISSMDQAAHIEDLDEVSRTYARQARKVFNVLGNPALALPTGFSSQGLPLGMQVVAKPFDEAMTLRVGYAYEQASDWQNRRPPLLSTHIKST